MGASSPPAYGSDPGTVPIRNATGPRMTANLWPDGLMNQPRSAGIAARQAGLDGVEGAAIAPSTPQDPVDRPVDAGIRFRAVPGEQERSHLAAEGRRDGLRRVAAQADDQGPARAGSFSDRRRSKRGVGSMPYSGRRRMTSVRRVGILAMDEHGPDELRSRQLEQRRGEPALDLGQFEVALRRRLDHRQDRREGPGPILARGQGEEDLPELVRVGVGQQAGQGLGPVRTVRLRGEIQQQRERQGAGWHRSARRRSTATGPRAWRRSAGRPSARRRAPRG